MKIYLGIDYGKKRIGFATGQSISKTASELTTVENFADAINWNAIDTIISDWRPAAIVLGMAKHADGKTSASSRQIDNFARQLTKRYHIDIYLQDEFQSSVEARAELTCQRRTKIRRKKVTKTVIDQIAARIILQRWLDENI